MPGENPTQKPASLGAVPAQYTSVYAYRNSERLDFNLVSNAQRPSEPGAAAHMSLHLTNNENEPHRRQFLPLSQGRSNQLRCNGKPRSTKWRSAVDEALSMRHRPIRQPPVAILLPYPPKPTEISGLWRATLTKQPSTTVKIHRIRVVKEAIAPNLMPSHEIVARALPMSALPWMPNQHHRRGLKPCLEESIRLAGARRQAPGSQLTARDRFSPISWRSKRRSVERLLQRQSEGTPHRP